MENQQKYEALFRDNPEAVVYLDMDFKVLDVNPRFCGLFGYSADEVKGKHINELVVPDDRLEEARELDKAASRGFASHDTVRKRKDGSLLPISISATPVSLEGKLLGYVGTYKDITERKNLEEKLRVVGSLTRHDVHNKLSVIAGNAYLLRERVAGDPEALEYLRYIEGAVSKVERILEDARIYEKLGVEQRTYIDAEEILDEAVSLFSDLKGIEIANQCAGLTVLADSLLRQVFYNLIENSLKHGEKTKVIRVHYGNPIAGKLELVYEDDGVGIPSDKRSDLFKEGVGKGTGHGLSLIKRICEVYGWTIEETGKQGQGAQFTIGIPEKDKEGRILYKLQK